MDLFERLTQHAAARPDDVALRTISASGTESITFYELIDRARALSQILRDAGIAGGARVGLLMPNDHWFGVALLAVASADGVAVPLDPSYETTRLCAVVSHADCRLLLSPGDGPMYAQAQAIRDVLTELIVLDPRCAEQKASSIPWPLVARDPDSDLLVMYTGGTTGAAKGVRLSTRGILLTIRDTLDVFPLSASDNVLSILPLFHIMAIQANLLGPLYAGAQVSYLQSRDPAAIVDAFSRYQITAFLCVPLFYVQLHRRIFGEVARQPRVKRTIFGAMLKISRLLRTSLGWNAGRLLFRPVHARFGSRLRGFGVGGARFAPEIASDLHDLGFEFFQGYGMTETSGLAAISPMSLAGGLSCGSGLKNLEIRIHNPDHEGNGEILLRGGNIMMGYWKDEDATAAALDDGWLHTGDIGRLESNNLRVIGRRKEVIVLSSGKNIFPEPLEMWFSSNCSFIQEICVFGVNLDGGERLQALVVPDSVKLREAGIVNVREELRYHIENLNRRLPPHEKLNGFEVRMEPLPRTSARKLQRFRIEQEFSRTQPAVFEPRPVGPSPVSPGLATVTEMIGRIKPGYLKAGSAIRQETNLELDLSLDSLERVELLSNVQDALGIEISPEQASSIFTAGDILALAKWDEPIQGAWSEWNDILRRPLSDHEREVADRYLSARPVAAPLFFIATRMFCLVSKLLFRFRVRFPDKWPEAPFILCANHQSYLDFPLIAGSLPYRFFKLGFSLSATRLLRGGFQSWFGVAARSVPIDSDRNLKSSLRVAAEGLRRGMVMCVFPEGHRSIDGNIQPFRKGAAIVAVEGGVSAVPIGIRGTGRVWGRASKAIHLEPIEITFGEPLTPQAGESDGQFNKRLLHGVQELIRSPVV